MIIKVDVREAALLEKINNLVSTIGIFENIVIKSETLPIGDIIICDNNDEKLVIERKSINDLLSSIKDGRYEEQSYRLNGLDHHNHNIIYLVEGDVNKNYYKPRSDGEKLMAYSAMFSLNYYKGFSVFRSFSMDETATIICNMAYKLEKESTSKKAFYKNPIKQTVETTTAEEKPLETVDNEDENTEINEQTVKDYVNVIKKVKKENITPDNIGEIMLCQIPGISSVTALAIMNKFGTLSNLITQIQENENCLKDISYTNSKNQVRKVNKTCLVNLVKFLLNK